LVLWVCVLLLALLTLSLARLVGQLHKRLGPAGALVTDHGPGIGERLAEVFRDPDVAAGPELEFPRQHEALLVFVSPKCPACVGLLSELAGFQRDSLLEVYVISGARVPEQNALLQEKARRAGVLFLPRPELVRAVRVGPTPYAVWLDRAGVVRAKGLVNNLEHLESLAHARASGFASLKEYFDTLEVNGSSPHARKGTVQ
jgi:methylamine dehydrogenase accessory protein MauD